MKTRSQTRNEKKNTIMKHSIDFDTDFKDLDLLSYNKPIYNVDINFDAASIAWKKNKIYIGNGCYKYTPLNI